MIDILLPADTSADVLRTILCDTSWERSQLRGNSRAGTEGRAQIRRGKGGSKFPGKGNYSCKIYEIGAKRFTQGEKSVGEGE